MKTTAIVLAAGKGSRMHANIPKQYMEVSGKPLIFYALRTFEESFIDEIILVVSPGDIQYCQREIVKKYGFHKVTHIVEGGKERYHSVHRGLHAADPETDYVFIHDGARPCVSEKILERAFAEVQEYQACVVGMPVKDTIKIADSDGFTAQTPDRNLVWTVQTPQVFSCSLILKLYDRLIAEEAQLWQKGIRVTDDAMVVETFSDVRIRLVEGSYSNIKVTTPEDVPVAELLLRREAMEKADWKASEEKK
ncbi:MAG: 2-C-methyl-D-erythritol 4-phosphate cytidylyltransferase [Butyrivibrio sp.]|nr:2-C-methyl-D-erythritol 4-phosphate cytidylyltransferase [Butyrivibrio sp.]